MGEPQGHVLSGLFLISPVGWLPRGPQQQAMAFSLASLGQGKSGDEEGAEAGLLFSAN